jgi:hypothetical protein
MFIHKKLECVPCITLLACKNRGFGNVKLLADSREVSGLISIEPQALTVTVKDQAAYIMQGGYMERSFRPTELRLVDADTNQLLVAWGDEFQ